jgi:hypothetical protein
VLPDWQCLIGLIMGSNRTHFWVRDVSLEDGYSVLPYTVRCDSGDATYGG